MIMEAHAHAKALLCDGCGTICAFITLNTLTRGYVDLCDVCLKTARKASKRAAIVRAERRSA